MKIAKVVKIENNIISLEFTNLSIRKFLRDNFAKEPYVGQKVEILDNGLIVEVEKKEEIKKVASKSLQALSISMLIIFLILLTLIIYKKVIFFNSFWITSGILIYLLATLVMFCLSTFLVNNKIINFLVKFLFGMLILICSVSAIIYILSIIWVLVACYACL